MQQNILKISIIHILCFSYVQTKNLAIKLCQQSISPWQSISNDVLFSFLLFDDIRKRFNKFNPLSMSTCIALVEYVELVGWNKEVLAPR
jgi:hypothetical protein